MRTEGSRAAGTFALPGLQTAVNAVFAEHMVTSRNSMRFELLPTR